MHHEAPPTIGTIPAIEEDLVTAWLNLEAVPASGLGQVQVRSFDFAGSKNKLQVSGLSLCYSSILNLILPNPYLVSPKETPRPLKALRHLSPRREEEKEEDRRDTRIKKVNCAPPSLHTLVLNMKMGLLILAGRWLL
ncbi:hypothetical protein JOB18_022868 [Solea senegalensis]|uniref:Uncharacterized protein n=1 Tax=Solea senegalensis TaxID=28829 RepID=A0AAV6QFD8_SOLSE|nr:hypothetical protein JOB18_022868 [Solea senegalensis]